MYVRTITEVHGSCMPVVHVFLQEEERIYLFLPFSHYFTYNKKRDTFRMLKKTSSGSLWCRWCRSWPWINLRNLGKSMTYGRDFKLELKFWTRFDFFSFHPFFCFWTPNISLLNFPWVTIFQVAGPPPGSLPPFQCHIFAQLWEGQGVKYPPSQNPVPFPPPSPPVLPGARKQIGPFWVYRPENFTTEDEMKLDLFPFEQNMFAIGFFLRSLGFSFLLKSGSTADADCWRTKH